MMRMKFSTRIGIYTLIASLVPLCLAITASIFLSSGLTVQLTMKSAEGKLAAWSEELNGFFRERQAEITLLASSPALRDQPFELALPYLNEALQRNQDTFEKFILGHTDGTFLNTSGGNPYQGMIRTFDDTEPDAKPRSIKARDYWQATVGKSSGGVDKIFLSNPMISYTTGVRQVVIAATVRDRNNLVKGLIGGSLPWEVIEAKLNEIKERVTFDYPNARFALVAGDGTYWYHWDESKTIRIRRDDYGNIIRTREGEKASESTSILEEKNSTLAAIGRDMISGNKGYRLFTNGSKGENEYAIYTGIGETGYSLFLVVPEKEILAPVANLKSLLLTPLIVAIVMAVLVSMLLSRQLAAPVVNLKNAIQKFDPEIDDPDIVHSDLRELNDLSEAFQETAARVRAKEKQRRQELLSAYDQLQVEKNAAERANAAKSDFLANMSHEIRTPMNAISGMADLCLLTEMTPTQQNYLHKLKSASRALLVLINDILDFSKIEAGKLNIEEVPFSLKELMEDLANVISIAAENKGIEFMIQSDLSTPFFLKGDPLRVNQILINLCSNAVKYTEEGQVVVSIRPVEKDFYHVVLEITVKDSGIGIDADKLPHLFDEFYQTDSSTTRKYGGTGLGLAIVKKLVGLMNGKVSASSEPGKGSEFVVTIPFNITEQKQFDFQRYANQFQSKSVLVVDDNAQAREIFSQLITRFGCDVETAVNGTEALSLCQSKHYDLIILDWNMPDIDGIETYRRLKEMDIDLPAVIMASAHSHSRIKDEARQAGIRKFLSKPVMNSVLYDAVADALVNQQQSNWDDTEDPLVDQDGLIDQVNDGARGARILVVEDTTVNLEIAQALLEQAGFLVLTAVNGAEAIDVLEREPVDLVLMDVQMPVMDGYEATRRIRKESKYQHLPILAMTANAMVGDREQCIEAGMNDHLAKPIDLENMLIKINHWLTV
jgi:signal transduction histidine kinase/CheY-like chemotaxis protein